MRILAHFTNGDQFMGFSGSAFSGSSHHTMSSDGDMGVVGVGFTKDGSELGEGAMLQLVHHWHRQERSFSGSKTTVHTANQNSTGKRLQCKEE